MDVIVELAAASSVVLVLVLVLLLLFAVINVEALEIIVCKSVSFVGLITYEYGIPSYDGFSHNDVFVEKGF